MKVQLKDLVNSADIPSEVPGQPGTPGPLSRFVNVEMRIKESFRLKGILKQANEYLSQYGEARLALFKKHGTHDEEAGVYELKSPEQRAAFSAEYQELISTEVEITGEPFRLANFFSHSKITAADLMTLEWLIDDEAGEVKPATIVKPLTREWNGMKVAPQGEVETALLSKSERTESDDLLEIADAKAA